ncbi:MAG TPA: beta-ketoacyl synthase N-terminal-like domain-containing protein, partial [Gammaproteobacteria bacterium]|nr:beta-ketoacyl synthase N-terminal-like domain-containing protein [Gammaproteobacteria bacterium]
MIRVLSTGAYLQPLSDGEPLPALKEALHKAGSQAFRRVDRFIQLALLGSARCAAGRSLRTDCGVYLGSGYGPLGENIATQEQLIREREIPMPFDFINTLGNTAGFHVAKNFALQSPNVFVSRRGASFEAVLAAAFADLTLGVVTQALVGIVEEATLPLAEHRRRLGLVDGVPLAEGSHWLLLEAGADGARALSLQRHAELAAVEGALKTLAREGDRLCCAQAMESSAAKRLRSGFPGAILG